jgi:hypothetical protein
MHLLAKKPKLSYSNDIWGFEAIFGHQDKARMLHIFPVSE